MKLWHLNVRLPWSLDATDRQRAATRAISIFHSGRANAGTVMSVLATRCPPRARSRAAITGARSWPCTTYVVTDTTSAGIIWASARMASRLAHTTEA